MSTVFEDRYKSFEPRYKSCIPIFKSFVPRCKWFEARYKWFEDRYKWFVPRSKYLKIGTNIWIYVNLAFHTNIMQLRLCWYLWWLICVISLFCFVTACLLYRLPLSPSSCDNTKIMQNTASDDHPTLYPILSIPKCRINADVTCIKHTISPLTPPPG